MSETKDKIMLSAFKLFLENGFTDVSMADIKKASDVATGTFYYYFSSKEELIVEVIDKYVFSYFDFALDLIKGYERTSKEELYYVTMQIIGYDVYTKQWSDFFSELNISDYRRIHLLYLEGIQKYDLMTKKYAEFNLKSLNYIKSIVVKGQKSHQIRGGDVDQLTKFIQSTILGTFLMWIAIPDFDLIRLMKSNLDQMWDYLSYDN